MSGSVLVVLVAWALLGAMAAAWHVIALSSGLRDLRFCEAMAFGKKNADEIQRTCRKLFGYGPVAFSAIVLSAELVWPYSLYHAARTLMRLRHIGAVEVSSW